MKRILLALAAVAITSGAASAQYSDELRARNRRASVERFAFEFGVGTYTPDAGRTAIFSGDRGPQLRMEFDVLPLRIPYVGMLGAGFSFSWVKLDGKLCATATCDENDSLDDSGRLRLFPLAPLAVLRVDVLARELGIPIVLTGKIGPDIIRYDVDGGSSTGSGTVYGLRWAAQVALELDFISPRRVASLDADWGINHSYLLFELMGSNITSGTDFGDSLTWTVGLGLTF